MVRDVLPDSAASKAGLKRHDVLLELGGKPVPDQIGGLVKLMNDIKADAKVDAVVVRKGKKETIKDLSLPEPKAFGPGFGNFPPPVQGAGGFAPPGGFPPPGAASTRTSGRSCRQAARRSSRPCSARRSASPSAIKKAT